MLPILVSRQLLEGLHEFLRDVLAKPKVFLIGNDHDLAELAGHQS